MAEFSDAMSATLAAYIATKAAVFDGDDDLSTVTFILRVERRGGSRSISRIFHRSESEGADVRAPAPPPPRGKPSTLQVRP